ncbi:uncharacterized protein MEPE_00529 [Melanopsichium pennsylvanicum]|uniref:Uncharacterized protein n=2 Tax=Melanopsichium pennsylvanicum TaxID=63383 RepID=A0AAJ5C2W0_9BASI|nr:putative protein [Melanopsichium pennsylvanicum 4]SNX81824.1 uncharacterized protein MEPE_00529 [Melanopsichium pennsylvanicum]
MMNYTARRSPSDSPSGSPEAFSASMHHSMKNIPLESPPPIIASSSRAPLRKQTSVSPPRRKASKSPSQILQQPMIMGMSTASSTSSIESSPFHQPSSRRLFHDTPTASHDTPKLDLVSPTAPCSAHNEARTPTAAGNHKEDVFGRIDHTPLRQQSHSTSPLPNSRSLQMGDMLDQVLDADQFSRLSVGNIIAPERNSSKKPLERLSTKSNSITASPTPLSRSTLRSRSTLTSIAVSKRIDASEDAHLSSSTVSDPFMQWSCPSADELSLHVKHQMAALQESPQTY